MPQADNRFWLQTKQILAKNCQVQPMPDIYIYSQNLPQWPPSTKVGGHCGEIGV